LAKAVVVLFAMFDYLPKMLLMIMIAIEQNNGKRELRQPGER
jgi:hypothetical protein